MNDSFLEKQQFLQVLVFFSNFSTYEIFLSYQLPLEKKDLPLFLFLYIRVQSPRIQNSFGVKTLFYTGGYFVEWVREGLKYR